MAAYTYEEEQGILAYLDKICAGTPVKFFWTNTRANSAIINKRLGIKYVQCRYTKGTESIEIYLMKNFAKESSDWRKMLPKIQPFVASLINTGKLGAGLRYYADTGEVLPINSVRKSAYDIELEELAAAKASELGELGKGLSPDLQKTLSELLNTLPKHKGTDKELMDALRSEDRGGQVADFTEALKDGKHILLPNQAWKSTGFSREAASKGVRVLRLDTDSPLLALPLESFKKLADGLGYTVTEEHQSVVPRMANIQPNPVTKSAQYGRAVADLTSRPQSNEEKELELLENPEATLKMLDEKLQQRANSLTADEKKMYNVLKRAIDNNELSLLNTKKLRLAKAIEAQFRARPSQEAELAAIRKKFNADDNRGPSSVVAQRGLMQDLTNAAVAKVIQVKKTSTYWTAVSINGVAIVYT